MKLEYIESQTTLATIYSPSMVPRLGDMVYLDDELFFIENVVWYPNNELVRVYLSTEKQTQKPKVAETKNNNVKLDQVANAQRTADVALKEATNLKKQVFSIRQFLRTQSKK